MKKWIRIFLLAAAEVIENIVVTYNNENNRWLEVTTSSS